MKKHFESLFLVKVSLFFRETSFQLDIKSGLAWKQFSKQTFGMLAKPYATLLMISTKKHLKPQIIIFTWLSNINDVVTVAWNDVSMCYTILAIWYQRQYENVVKVLSKSLF